MKVNRGRQQVNETNVQFFGDLVENTVECGDGSKALADYRGHQPDLVLMDLKMAGMEGLAATRQIIECFPETRIVMVSQCEDKALREAAHLAVAEAYVGKTDLLPLRRILTNA